MISRSKLDKLLWSFDVKDYLQELVVDGELQRVFPEVHAMVGFGGVEQGHKDLWEHTKQVVHQCPREHIIRWAALFHDVGKVQCFTRNSEGEVSFHHHEVVSARLFRQAARRTQLFNVRETSTISFIIENLGYLEAYESSWTDSAVRRLYNTLGGANFEMLLSLSRADITTKHESKRQAHHSRIKELEVRAKVIQKADSITPMLPSGLGEDISRAFGIPPSPTLGKIMNRLREAVKGGELPWPPTVEEALEYVRTKCIFPKSEPPAIPET
jgi:poly(A) polymerase